MVSVSAPSVPLAQTEVLFLYRQMLRSKMMALSLTFDHRAVDGAPAARFLQQVKWWIEQPYAWLTR